MAGRCVNRFQPPAIDPRLEELNAVVRSTECLRHFVLSIEFWISPSGQLRQWMKLNVCLAAFLLIPAIVLMPIIGLVLHEVDGWLSMLLSIAWKLIVLSILVSVVVCVATSQNIFHLRPRVHPEDENENRLLRVELRE